MSKTKKNPPPSPVVGDTVFLVKYVMSSGIRELEVESFGSGWAALIQPGKDTWPRTIMAQRKDIALDAAERDERVLSLIKRKLVSLAKQKAKLEKLCESYTLAEEGTKSP